MTMQSAVPWLPDAIVAARLPTATIELLVEEWSRHWFAEGRARLGEWERADHSDHGDSLVPVGEGLFIAVSPGALDRLASMMFGGPAESPTTADRARLDRAAGACLDDLRRRLARLFGVPATEARSEASSSTTSPVRRRAIGLGSGDGLGMIATDALLVRWIRASLPPPSPAAQFRPLAAALGLQEVSVSALAGRCRVPLGDLAACAAGDVLLLDRPTDAPLDLAVNGRVSGDRPCRLVEAGGAFRLVLA